MTNSCGHELSLLAKFCGKCGAKADVATHHHCGGVLLDDPYCHKCGEKKWP